MKLKRTKFFAPEGAGAGAGGSTDGKGAGDGEKKPADGKGQGEGEKKEGKGDGKEGEKKDEELKFSTEALAERLARAEKKKERELRAALGLDDATPWETVKAALADRKKAEADKKTEAEKTAEKLSALEKRAAEAEQKAAYLDRVDFLRRSAARVEGAGNLVDDPDALAVVARELAAFGTKEGLGDDERPDAKGMVKFFAALRTAKPFLFAGAADTRPNTTGGDGGAPGAGKGTKGGDGKVSALNMSSAEWAAHKAKFGLRT